MTDYELMGAALAEAEQAAALGEVPVGAVVARDGEIIAAAHNTRETEKNALHHAELLAIDAACKKLGGWRLWQCELFVTLEPCPMCSGGHHQQPDQAGGVRRGRHQGGLLRLGDRPVRHALQPPPGGGAGPPRRGGTGAFAGLFPPIAGKAGRKTPLEAADHEVKNEKMWELREKSFGSHFLFSRNCAILFNGNLSKPHAIVHRHAAGPDLTGRNEQSDVLGSVGPAVSPAGVPLGTGRK